MPHDEKDFTNAQFFRKKAEEMFEYKTGNTLLPDSEKNDRKLYHELQIHQLELELQNEALCVAHVKAEVALKKYTILFDMSAMGYFLIQPDATINELNYKAADILHERRFALKGANFKLFVTDETKPVFNDFLKKIYSNHTKESCKILMNHNGESPREIFLEGVVIDDEQQCLLSVVNLSKFGNQH